MRESAKGNWAMQLKLYPIALLLCMIGGASGAVGQEKNPETSGCAQQSFDEAESSYRMRWRDSELKARAEHQLNTLVRSCPATPERDQAEQRLQDVREELAESYLSIAKFYLKNRSNSGARSRLQAIVERYAKFTKLDEVLSLLGRLNMDGGYLDDAAASYKKLLNDFPNSQYAGEAFIQLSIIDVMRINQKP
jgi:outer membrane protein assembly factor BamD (BamD/ComL family)